MLKPKYATAVCLLSSDQGPVVKLSLSTFRLLLAQPAAAVSVEFERALPLGGVILLSCVTDDASAGFVRIKLAQR